MKKGFLIGLLAAAACSSDPPLPPEDAGPADTGPGRFDRDNDGILDRDDNCPDVANPDQNNDDGDVWGDVCDRCPTINQSQCISVNEVEPNDMDGQMITLAGNDEWLEVLGELSPEDPRDRYLLTVTTEVRLKTRVVRRLDSNFEPLLVASGGTYTVEREVDGERIAERWLYFFGPGTYQLEVRDRRGASTEKVGYALHLLRDQWVDTALNLPLADELNANVYNPDPPNTSFDMSDGEVFGISVASDNRYIMELRAETSTGTVDPILVHRFSGQEFVNVGRSARLLLEDRPGLFILDHRRKTTPAAQVSVTARYFWLPENEPNNSPETATPVPPQSRMMGWITEPNPGPDVDWFRFQSDPTKVYVVEATVPGAYFYREEQKVDPPEIEWKIGTKPNALRRCVFPAVGPPPQEYFQQMLIAPKTDYFYVEVGDHRNLTAPYWGWTPTPDGMGATMGHFVLSVYPSEFSLLGETVQITDSATLTFSFERRGAHLVEIVNANAARLTERIVATVDVVPEGTLTARCSLLQHPPLSLDPTTPQQPHYLLVLGRPVDAPQTTPQIQYYFSLTPE